jgi:hypothetical protein
MDLGRARKILNLADSAFIAIDDEERITCHEALREGFRRLPFVDEPPA